MSLIGQKLHSTAVRWMYRILAPGHPRGWIDVHAVVEEQGTGLWIHTHGMGRWRLADIEMVGVPPDLRGYAHGILFDVIGYMKREKPIRADENFGGMLISRDQIVVEYCTFRRVSGRPERDPQGEYLRIVDLGEPEGAGFPFRFFAAHLCALGRAARNLQKQVRLLRRATELDPGDCSQNPQDLGACDSNPGNYFSWEALGDALCDLGRGEEGIECLREAAARWPFAAADYAGHIRQLVQNGELPPPDQDARSRFWCELDVDDNLRQILARHPREA
jgi:hypothetical protein